MKTDIKLNLLDDSIIVKTFEKVIKFEIKKQDFLGDGSVGTLRVKMLTHSPKF